MCSPRRRVPLNLLSLAFASVSLRVAALTASFDDQDTLVTYSPLTAWRSVTVEGFVAGRASEAVDPGAKVEFSFAGEQVSLYGQNAASFAVLLDGRPARNLAKDSYGTPADESTRFFLASTLDANQTHSLYLEYLGGGTLRLDRIAIAYSDSTGRTPTLVVAGSNLTDSTGSSSSTSPAASADDDPGTPSGGIIAGAVIGSLAAVALIVFLVFVFLRRRRHRSSDSQPSLDNRSPASQYFNTETGEMRSRSAHNTFLAALSPRTSRISPLPFSNVAVRNSLGANGADGGIGRSPHPYALPTYPSRAAVAPDDRLAPPDPPPASVPWTQRLARASSWRRKASRLPETQRFYGVSPSGARTGGAGLPADPPPARPLPNVPGGEGREMRQRWREDGPALVQGSGRRSATPRQSQEDEHGRRSKRGGTKAAKWRNEQQEQGTLASEYSSADSTAARRSGMASPTPAAHPIAAAHLRRRSWPRPAAGGADGVPSGVSSSTALSSGADGAVEAFPAPPSPAAHSFRNPFGSTSSASVAPSHRGRTAHSAHASQDSWGTSRTGTGTGSSLDGSVHFARAEPAARGAVPVPLRMSSMREVHETYRAGPRGDASSSGVREAEGATLARKPTFTSAERAEAAGSRREQQQDHGKQEQDAGQREKSRRHRSAAALVEVVEELGLPDEEGDPPPGEEDRSAFFSQRERMPRYSQDKGDPRLRR